VVTNEDVSCVFFLNCGGIIDLASFLFEGSVPSYMKLFVLDCHRPIHLANIISSGDVLVLDDGYTGKEIPDLEVFQHLAESDASDDSDGAEEEDTSSEDEDANPRPRQRARGSNGQALPSAGSKKRARRAASKVLKNYYRSSYFGGASALVALTLSMQLSRSQKRHIWWSIVALTAHLVGEHIDRHFYGLQRDKVHEHVLLQSDHRSRKSSAISIAWTDDVKIEPSNDLRFFLHRHWTLRESMLNSPFVASRLQLWRTTDSKLNWLMAQMGIPSRDASVSYSSMRQDVRVRLEERLNEFGATVNLSPEELSFPSFLATFGFNRCYSASDVAYGIAALLRGGESSHSSPSEKFTLAYDALASMNSIGLVAGFQRAKSLQQSTMQQAQEILQAGKYGKSKHFVYILLGESTADLHLWCQPSNLENLALFIAAALREKNRRQGGERAGSRRRNLGDLPLVMAAANLAEKSHVVVGVNSAADVGVKQKSSFGLYFRKAAELSRARYRHDRFETSVMEIESSDVQNFFSALNESFLS